MPITKARNEFFRIYIEAIKSKLIKINLTTVKKTYKQLKTSQMIFNKPSIVASFALLQLQAVSAWRDYPQDLTWPEDNCCRLYRHMEFRSRPEAQWPEGEYDWYDFCVNPDRP